MLRSLRVKLRGLQRGASAEAVSVVLMLAFLSFIGFASQQKVIGPPLIPQPGKLGGTVTLALTQELETTLNPLFTIRNPIIELTMSSLVDINRISREIEPAIAADFNFSEDGRAIIFSLRKGLKWSDGTPLTTDDIVFSFNTYFNENLPTIIKLPGDIKRQFRIEVLGPFAVKVTAPGPIPIDQIAFIKILPRHKLGNIPLSRLQQAWTLNTPAEQFVGLGPFRIIEIVRTDKSAQKIVLERNPYFWQVDQKGQRLPYLDRLTIRFVKEGEEALGLFKRGDVDMQVLTDVVKDALVRAVQLEKEGFRVVSTGPELDLIFLIFNQDDPSLGEVFQDVRFRRAVNLALNRQALVALFPGERGFPAFSFIHPLSLFFEGSPQVEGFDPNRAKRLLDEMGLKDTDGDGVREFKGKPLRFEMLTNQEMGERVEIGRFLGKTLTGIGITVDLRPIPAPELSNRLLFKPARFQAVVVGFGEFYDPTFQPFNLGGLFDSRSNVHFYRFSDAQRSPQELPAAQRELDKLLQQLGNTFFLTLEEKRKIIFQITQILIDDLPVIPLGREAFILVAQDALQNVQNIVEWEPPSGVPLVWAVTYVWRK